MSRLSFWIAAMATLWTAVAVAQVPQTVRFNEHVRPILANHCWSCHGPDEASRQGGLRLDLRSSAIAKADSGRVALDPGRPDASELVARINAHDEDCVMPPPAAKKPLTEVQKNILKRWIEQGAEYAGHWAFNPPNRPAVPTVKHQSWVRHPLDAFILQKLEDSKLRPSPEASAGTWLRRVTLDLTGLPPSIQELDEFLAECGDGKSVQQIERAYEQVVDRLLKSPRYAERMAMLWLDAARFADTNGYNNDEMRTMWPWRDWVIDAFARGMPYDQFLTEQLAGDLLPDASLSQKVATGFNRNHVLTTEGGIIEEEYHVEYVADRVHTTATVFLAMSLQCARCHDHKYDPVTQRDYYRFSAFFNNVPDRVVPYSQGRMAEPLLKVPTREQQQELARLDARRTELESALQQRAKSIDDDLEKWEQSLTAETIGKLGPAGLVSRFSLDETEGEQVADSVDATRRGTIKGKATRGTGKAGGSLSFDGNTFVDAGQIGVFDNTDAFSFAVWIQPTSNEATAVLSKIDEANAFRGYDVIMESGKVATHFVHQWPGAAFKLQTKQPVSLNEWHHVTVTYDGSKKATGVKIYVDGEAKATDVTTNNQLTGTLKTDKPFHIGKRQNSAPFKGQIDDLQIYSVALSADDVGQLAKGQVLGSLKDVLAVKSADRTDAQRNQLRQFYLDRIDAAAKELKAELAELPKKREAIDKAIPVTMVMAEQPTPRQTFILKRGQYDQRGEVVTSGLPFFGSTVPTTKDASSLTRLDLAKWLTSPNHPLTARVAVNRWWEMFFGVGLVETSEDFGIQGALPSHPELLDWLATELVRSGWDQRAMLRSIVLSATYRQSSDFGPRAKSSNTADQPDPHVVDPRNRLLWRGPRYRLSAETMRDAALAMSGLLKEKIGGPSVKPYQPEGLWEDVSVERREKYVPDFGDGLYRRSMYTFWKRTSPPPSMSTFDAPDRETCVVRRSRTNTPLQALVLLNDPTYVEAARKLAEKTLQAAKNDDERMTFVFKLLLSRSPAQEERTVIKSLLQQARARFGTNAEAAQKLLSVGHSKSDTSLAPTEHASWTALVSTLMNLDEVISKN